MCVHTKRINVKDFFEVKMQEWQDYLHDIFSDRNKELEPRLIWLKVIEHSTRLAEGIRKRKFFEAVSSVARVFCWTCCFVSNNPSLLDTASLEDIVWQKYPRTCSYCVPPLTDENQEIIKTRKALPCRCGPDIELEPQKMATAKNLEVYRKQLHKPESLDDWVRMIDAIYGTRHSLMSLDSICFHFLEEVGEVLTAMRIYSDFTFNIPKNAYSFEKAKQLFKDQKLFGEIFGKGHGEYQEFIDATKQAVKQEVADVMSWLFSLTLKLLQLRTSFSDYEREAYVLIKKIPEQQAFSRLTGYDIVRPPPVEDRILNLSSILFIWYANGCQLCRNFLETKKDRCQCSRKISRLFITSESPEVQLHTPIS